jgi:hypothetical protein
MDCIFFVQDRGIVQAVSSKEIAAMQIYRSDIGQSNSKNFTMAVQERFQDFASAELLSP